MKSGAEPSRTSKRSLGGGLATGLRLTAIASAVVLSAASAQQRTDPNTPYSPASSGEAPPPRAMAPAAATGLWKTTFGPVKIELDNANAGQVRGIWYYKRGTEEVIGDFGGQLRGNVLQFQWREPAQPQNLTGSGYLVFDPRGQRFHGKWWTESRDRSGTWTGWRAGRGAGNTPPPAQPPADPNGPTDPSGSPDQPPHDPNGPPDPSAPTDPGQQPPPAAPDQPPAGTGTSLPPM